DIALSWLVYRLTGSAFLLGAVIFCKQIPNFLLGPATGLVADRYNKRRVIITMQMMAMLQAAMLAILVLTDQIQVWQIFCLSFLLGVGNAFDITARQSFIIDMVDEPGDLNNAIALNSITFNVARLIGPSIAALLLAFLGEGVCFLINAVSFLGVIAALLAMHIPPKEGQLNEEKKSVFHEMQEGYLYAYQFPPIRYTLLLVGLVSFMGLPYTVLMPIFVTEVFFEGPELLGLLMGSIGLGAICGAAFLASRPNVAGLENMIPLATGVFGIALLTFSQTKLVWLAFVILFFAGLGMILQSASSNTLLQTVVEDDKRGRIMGLFSMANSGMLPFGSLLAGFLANQIGAPATAFIGGLSCLIGALLFANRLPKIREYLNLIYVRLGIIQNE
ncbi:MAG TPA: MFS transporter, partial [Negativicutes bacterium]